MAEGAAMRVKERLAIPNLGNYTIALDSAVRSLGIEPWSSTKTQASALRLGIAAAPESLCLPFKAHLGHFIEADDAGCGHALMVNSLGTCRLSYYRMLIENILRDMGRGIKVWGLGFDGIKPPVIRYFNPPLFPFIHAVFLALEKIRIIDIIEIAAWKARPLEACRGDVTKLTEDCFAGLAAANTIRAVKALKATYTGLYEKIPRKNTGGIQPVKVGLIGEISLLRDRTLNQNVEVMLGELGVEVRNFFLLGAELGNIFGWGTAGQRAFTRKELAKIARPYLANPVGGHALDSVAHTLRCAEGGFAGMVHLLPAGCMPEVSVRPILAQISREKHIPVLELTFDEHSAGAGLSTRIEAFVDMLNDSKKRGRSA
jgi:predicted nucleotide-binding protein (sugar kinase/HSP70/actin superfamily)